jgi:hypothetical protein
MKNLFHKHNWVELHKVVVEPKKVDKFNIPAMDGSEWMCENMIDKHMNFIKELSAGKTTYVYQCSICKEIKKVECSGMEVDIGKKIF